MHHVLQQPAHWPSASGVSWEFATRCLLSIDVQCGGVKTARGTEHGVGEKCGESSAVH